MKVVILHPPLYPMNHKFFNELGKKMDLVVYSFGNFPRLHSNWKVEDFLSKSNSYDLKIIKGNHDEKRQRLSLSTQLNPSFVQKVRQEQPDVLISIAFWMPSFYMAVLKHWFKCKLMIITDATQKTESKVKGIKHIIRRHIAKKTDTFIAASDLTKAYLEHEFPKVNVEMSLQTIDIEAWSKRIKKLASKEVLRAEFDIPKDKKILISVGLFIERKNFSSIINQLPYLDDVLLLLIGGGALESELIAQAKRLKVEHKLRLIERQEGDALKAYFKLSDMFVFPTREDAFGYVVMEALASGLPMVCSKHAGASTLIEEGSNGFIIEPNDYYYEEIKTVLDNLEVMSKNSEASIQKYTLKNKVEEFCEILK